MEKPKPKDSVAVTSAKTSAWSALLIPYAEEGKPPLYGITSGHYDHTGLVALLRYHKNNPKAIQFIADMLE